MSKTRDQYRRWIKDRHGSLHKVDTNDAYKGRKWRINQNHIRDTFIDEYESSTRTHHARHDAMEPRTYRKSIL